MVIESGTSRNSGGGFVKIFDNVIYREKKFVPSKKRKKYFIYEAHKYFRLNEV